MRAVQRFMSVAVAATILMAEGSVLFAAENKDDKTKTSETVAETTAETSSDASDASDASAESSSETSKLKTDPVSSDGKTFETLYGSQLPTYLNHEYEYNGQKIPVSESNYWFINSFNIISSYAVNYGMYPVTVENFVDLNTEFQPDEGLPTLGDYLVDYAEKTLTSVYASLDRAQAEGITLSDDYESKVNQIVTDISINKAASEGLTTDSYLELYYGPGCTMDVFKKILKNYYLSEQYAVKYCENYQHKPDDAKVPNIRYVLFYAPAGSSEEEVKKAETLANDLKAKASDLDTLKKLGDEAAAKNDGEEGKARETGDFITAKDQTVPAFDSWAWDASRKEGDIDVIKSEEYGYFVVGYLGKTDNDPSVLQNIAVDALQEEIFSKVDSGEIKLTLSEPYGKPAEVALATPVPEDGNGGTSATGETGSDTSGDTEAGSDASSSESLKPEKKDNGGFNRNTVIIACGCVGAVIAIVIIVIIVSRVSSKKASGDPSGKAVKTEKAVQEQADPSKDEISEEVLESVGEKTVDDPDDNKEDEE